MKRSTIQPGFIKKAILVLTLLVLLTNANIFAQDLDGEEEVDEDGFVTADGRPDPDAPLDGGVVILLAGGVVYGLFKAHQYNKSKKIA